jgi:hypothetical protein
MKCDPDGEDVMSWRRSGNSRWIELDQCKSNERFVSWRVDADVGSSCLPLWIKKLGKLIKVNLCGDTTSSLTVKMAAEASGSPRGK